MQVTLDPGYTYGNGFSLLEYAWHIAIWNALLAMLFGALAGFWARRVGPRRPLLLAVAIMAACGVAFALTPHTWLVFALLSAAFGVGFGAYYAATPNLIIEAVPQEQQGISAGMLEEAVGPWYRAYPKVPVETSVLMERPREALLDAAADADLLVVGDRGAGGLDPLPLGATSSAMLHHAPCTVAVVPLPREAARQ